MNSYDIIVLTETWLLDGVLNTELFDDRYLVFRRDRDYERTGQSRGGGVLIAVNHNLSAVLQPEWNSSAEDLWVTVMLKDNHLKSSIKIHLCSVYICSENRGLSASAQLSNFSSKLFDVMANNPDDIAIVVGDFNQPNIYWNRNNVNDLDLSPSNLTGVSQIVFIDIINSCNLLQYN